MTKYQIKYFNFEFEIEFNYNEFENSEKMDLLEIDSPIAREIGFTSEFFSKNQSILFLDNNILYISSIAKKGFMQNSNPIDKMFSVMYGSINMDQNNESSPVVKGKFGDLLRNSLEKGYNIVITSPFPKMVSILRKFGFRLYLTDENNPYGEPIEVYYFTQEMRKLPKIIMGIVGIYPNILNHNKMFLFALFQENSILIGDFYSETSDNFNIPFEPTMKKLENIWNNDYDNILELYPDGFIFCFYPITQEKDHFQIWFNQTISHKRVNDLAKSRLEDESCWKDCYGNTCGICGEIIYGFPITFFKVCENKGNLRLSFHSHCCYSNHHNFDEFPDITLNTHFYTYCLYKCGKWKDCKYMNSKSKSELTYFSDNYFNGQTRQKFILKDQMEKLENENEKFVKGLNKITGDDSIQCDTWENLKKPDEKKKVERTLYKNSEVKEIDNLTEIPKELSETFSNNSTRPLSKEENFKELWEMGMKHFKTGNKGFQVRFCVKNQIPIGFDKLIEKNCWKCEQFILNGGICDPI